MSLIFLSHELSLDTSGYGGKKNFKNSNLTSICCGQSSNTQLFEFHNHTGTHIDCPLHFFENQESIDKYPAEFWFFKKPHFCEISVTNDELITVNTLNNLPPEGTDLLLLKTNFEKHRGTDLYWNNNPGISPELGTWIKQNRKSIRLIGFDFISLSSYQNRQLGRVAHQVFLNKSELENPILILEDMKLSNLTQSPQWVLVSPLRVMGADGSPATVFAKI